MSLFSLYWLFLLVLNHQSYLGGAKPLFATPQKRLCNFAWKRKFIHIIIMINEMAY